MGVDVYAQALVGVRIPREKAFTIRRVRAFNHDFREDWSHDPKTGRELWRNETVNRLDGIAGLRVFESGTSDEQGPVFVARLLATKEADMDRWGPDGVPISPAAVEEERSGLEAILVPLRLWDPNAFRLWVAVRVSY